jgi:CheY-like chemotaxis protein
MIIPTRLLVEDERIIALDLARRLTTLGYTVLATAGSGREAIQQAVDLRPDLVLMDGRLTGGDGWTRGRGAHSGPGGDPHHLSDRLP